MIEEGEMVTCQLESEENEVEDKMVTVAVTIDEQLLRRLEASLHSGEEGLHSIRERDSGELQIRLNVSTKDDFQSLH